MIITMGLGSNALVTAGYGAVSGGVTYRTSSFGFPSRYLASRARNVLIGSLNLPFQTYITLKKVADEEEGKKKKKKK